MNKKQDLPIILQNDRINEQNDTHDCLSDKISLSYKAVASRNKNISSHGYTELITTDLDDVKNISSKNNSSLINDSYLASTSNKTRDFVYKQHASTELSHYGCRSKERTTMSSVEDQPDNAEKVKTKLLSVWNNMKYGWTLKVKTNFKIDSEIWLLGKCYLKKEERAIFYAEKMKDDDSIEKFKADFVSRLWFTYRRAFPVLAGSSLTSDCGWGCMLRSGQMLLAQAFIVHFLKRNWIWDESCQTREQEAYHRQIIKWFADNPPSPFSVHRLVTIGQSSGKKAGDWYGPASVAYILKEAMEQAIHLQTLLRKLCIYVATDCTVYVQDVFDLWTVSGTNEMRSLILLIPVRLGSDYLNPIYIPCLQELLKNKFCLGIIGGRPKHSLYFVGWQDDKLIHLDPHYCQEVIDTQQSNFPLQSFHCTSPRKMSFSRMDPSCTIGFYCRTKDEFEAFTESVSQSVIPPNQHVEYPMFIFSKQSKQDQQMDHSQPNRYLRITHTNSVGKILPHLSVDSKDDFVFL